VVTEELDKMFRLGEPVHQQILLLVVAVVVDTLLQELAHLVAELVVEMVLLVQPPQPLLALAVEVEETTNLAVMVQQAKFGLGLKYERTNIRQS
jgi:hypothetical protein